MVDIRSEHHTNSLQNLHSIKSNNSIHNNFINGPFPFPLPLPHIICEYWSLENTAVELNVEYKYWLKIKEINTGIVHL